MLDSKIVWSSKDEDDEQLHPCSACGEPCGEDEPLCWTCECGDPIKLNEKEISNA